MQRWGTSAVPILARLISSCTGRSALSPLSFRSLYSISYLRRSADADPVRVGPIYWQLPSFPHPPPPRPFFPAQTRRYAKNERSRAPITPTISKVKKYKLKAPSSMKFRFRTMKDGQIRRWHAGKRHNAHLKSKEAKRRLRRPALVHPAYAKVIKKLNFCG